MIKEFFISPVFLSVLLSILVIFLGEFIARPAEIVLNFAAFFLLSLYLTRKNEKAGVRSILKMLIFPALATCFIYFFSVVPKFYFHLMALAFIFIGAICGYLFVRKESLKWITSGVGIIALIIASFFATNEATVTAEWPFKYIPESVEGFVFTAEDGSKLISNDLKDDVAVLDFWYWGCKPCHAAMPDLQKYYEAHPEQKVYSVYDPLGNAKSYKDAVKELRDRGYTFPIVLSESETNRSLFLVTGFPTIMKVEQGKNVTSKVGKLSDL